MMNKKGTTPKSYIPIDSEKLKNAIMTSGMTVSSFARSLKCNRDDWAGYLYMGCSMPQDLFYKIVEALEIEPEDIAKESTQYGRSWNAKQHMIESLLRTFMRLRSNPELEPEFVDALSKFAPYLVPKAIQSDENYTPERWAEAFAKTILKVAEEEPEDANEQVIKDLLE